MESIRDGYRALRVPGSLALLPTAEYAQAIARLCLDSRRYLCGSCERVQLTSLVPGKGYFALRELEEAAASGRSVATSRPVNAALYIESDEEFAAGLGSFLAGDYSSMDQLAVTKLLYTMAMSFCAANDLLKARDKKTPATFFECFAAHLFARQFQAVPRDRVKVPSVRDELTELPTDYVFDLGAVKIHLPVKISTRERVIQAWAHQRVLEGVWGYQAFKGILVVLTETKLDLEKLQVTEICLPQQWAVYQRYIAKLDRVYYLDMPDRYATLVSSSPRIDVKPLGAFWEEKDILLAH